MSWVLDDDQEVVLICGDTRSKNKEERRTRSSLEVQQNRSTRSQSWACSWTGQGQGGGPGLVLVLEDGPPGAIMISFFLERTRRKVRSFWGSRSRMVVLAFISSWWISPAYWTVLVLSRVVLMGIPGGTNRQHHEIRSNVPGRTKEANSTF